eukprot:CAMPEP_0171832390 /NCGR_PEP_ID=MMETSP0992-20121227/9302_1 /TAXON_ID=483369 /ORGANISM="non described non described, Strain CCMP2098" /LENGTH=311 /DNA_ID=CAMNT_0012447899 /DNA_START=547 /DNA_END=1481 /DNA_ORIENTATION=+
MLMECRRRLAGVRGGKKGPTRVRVCDIARCTNGKLVKQAMPVLLFALPLFTNVLAAAAFSPTPLQAPEAATAKARVPDEVVGVVPGPCGVLTVFGDERAVSPQAPNEGNGDTADINFHAMAHVSETFVFLLMGMGMFMGRFSNWPPTFIVMAILFCLVARLFNTFPISFVANFTRTVKIPFATQLVIWFAGLRGAIAFALSQNMPGAHKCQYETTTLGVVFFTTVVCGGLTEKVITRAGMKRIDSGATSEDFSVDDQGDGGGGGRGGVHVWWKGVDAKFMKPYFGGSSAANNNKQSINSSTTNALFADDPT